MCVCVCVCVSVYVCVCVILVILYYNNQYNITSYLIPIRFT